MLIYFPALFFEGHSSIRTKASGVRYPRHGGCCCRCWDHDDGERGHVVDGPVSSLPSFLPFPSFGPPFCPLRLLPPFLPLMSLHSFLPQLPPFLPSFLPLRFLPSSLLLRFLPSFLFPSKSPPSSFLPSFLQAQRTTLTSSKQEPSKRKLRR